MQMKENERNRPSSKTRVYSTSNIFPDYLQIVIRQHLGYGDVVYDQPSNDAFSSKLEAVQYKAALAITGAIKGTAREKLYQELALEHIYMRPEVNSKRFDISLRCQVTSLSAFT